MKRYASCRKLAERYDVHPSTIWRWTQQGKLPEPEKLSEGCTRWDLEKVEAAEAKRGEVAR